MRALERALSRGRAGAGRHPRPAADCPPPEESFVGSSIQFLLPDWPAEQVQAVLARCARRGVELKWFGSAQPTGFTSRYDSWRYAPSAPMPESDRILAGIIDMRLPLTFSIADCEKIARIIRAEVGAVFKPSKAGWHGPCLKPQ